MRVNALEIGAENSALNSLSFSLFSPFFLFLSPLLAAGIGTLTTKIAYHPLRYLLRNLRGEIPISGPIRCLEWFQFCPKSSNSWFQFWASVQSERRVQILNWDDRHFGK